MNRSGTAYQFDRREHKACADAPAGGLSRRPSAQKDGLARRTGRRPTRLLARAKNPYAFPLAVFPLLFPVVYYVTHTSLRYRHPIDPILIFLTVLAVYAIGSKKYPDPASVTANE